MRETTQAYSPLPESVVAQIVAFSRQPKRRALLRTVYDSARASWPFVIVAVIISSTFAASPWPVAVTVRHLLAFKNCEAAREVGLAPANRGAPGYWSKLDADNDGVACEPWPRSVR
jgi:hypothetical protein